MVNASCQPEQGPVGVTSPDPVGDGPLVVTRIGLEPGETIETGMLLGEVSGHPRVAVVTPVPFYRDLGPGDSGEDVLLLETALSTAGLMNSPDATFDSRAAGAMVRLYREAGARLEQLGLPANRFNLTVIQSVVPESVVAQVLVSVGQVLQPGDALVTIGGPDQAFLCPVAPGLNVSAGMEVELVANGTSAPATVRSLGQADPQSGLQSLVVIPNDRLAGLGGSVELRIVVSETNGAVLTVPAAALFAGPSGGFTVRKVVSGAPEAIPVEVGIASGGYVEVRSDNLEHQDEVQINKPADPALPAGGGP
ncbi:MAG TPA: hypothetical protein VHL54_11330 [Actinomycetota bacterium]|nr:hypothetical protein [Actinomycetota bacterium]